MERQISGLHHITMIAGDPQRNIDFYTDLLGLRLVKQTVNYDDPNTYHLYYGDEVGHPGTVLTFFPWPGAERGRRGAGQTGEVALAIAPASLGFWIERLLGRGIAFEGPTERFGEKLLSFNDPDGLVVELVAHKPAAAWPGRATEGIEPANSIRGVHSVTVWEERTEATAAVLSALGFHPGVHDERRYRYVLDGDGPGTIVDLISVAGFWSGVVGVGSVHHVAWRTPTRDEQRAWSVEMIRAGLDVTPVRDRTYFESIYFREPGGVLFEIATEGPGFTVDEPPAHLGERLMLPSWLENARTEFERDLPPLKSTRQWRVDQAQLSYIDREPPGEGEDSAMPAEHLGFEHLFIPAEAEGSDLTLLLLHGTGGNERDLVPLGHALVPGAAILSPRGQVLENGQPRFFRRLAEGVFDMDDLHRRTADLATFVTDAATVYRYDPDRVVAVGFSNGANIAGSLLLSRPELLAGAVLLRPMVPFVPEPLPSLNDTRVFVAAGNADPLVPVEETERLVDLLTSAGAQVEVHWHTGGHGLGDDDVRAAQTWIERQGLQG